jgi:hypothetical protein
MWGDEDDSESDSSWVEAVEEPIIDGMENVSSDRPETEVAMVDIGALKSRNKSLSIFPPLPDLTLTIPLTEDLLQDLDHDSAFGDISINDSITDVNFLSHVPNDSDFEHAPNESD